MQMNFITQMLMNQLQQKNPQGFQIVNQAMQSNGNPQAILQQVLTNATPEQREGLLKQAKNYGVPNDVLLQIQNMK